MSIAKRSKSSRPSAKKGASTERVNLRLVKNENAAAFIASPKTHAKSYNDKYAAIFHQSTDAVMTVVNGKVDEVNEAFCEMTGYQSQEFCQLGITALVPAQGVHMPALSRPFSPFMLKSPGVYEDVLVTRKDGYLRWVEMNVRSVEHIESKSAELCLVLFRDVTEKKKLEREILTKHSELRNAYFEMERNNLELKATQESLVQAGKMAALGELSSGIAHELNQPLTGIRGFAQELESFLPKAIPNAKDRLQSQVCLEEIIRGVDKMVKIIKYLRGYARKSIEDIETVDVHHIIEESLKLLESQFQARGIRIQKNYSELPKIQTNATQLEQVFINFCTNARDAIESTKRGQGTLTISTSLVNKNREQFVEIAFKDDGIGMDEHVRKKVFNPFFTTKEVGKGMGLGLSISYGILTKLQGSILVESEAGRGSTFIVQLPVDMPIHKNTDS